MTNPYKPGEPYEFLIRRPYAREGFVVVYRCFRNGCSGAQVWVSDRDTHNSYHNSIDNGTRLSYDWLDESEDDYVDDTTF